MKWQVTLTPYWVRLLKQVNRLVINKAKTWDTTVLASPTFVYKCLFFNAFCHISFDRQKHLTLTKFSSYILYFVYRGDRPRGWNNACYLRDISPPWCQSRLGPLLHHDYWVSGLGIASHAAVFRGARLSSLPTNACSTANNTNSFPKLSQSHCHFQILESWPWPQVNPIITWSAWNTGKDLVRF